MAFGTMLSFDWVNGTTSTLDSPWLKLTGALQSTVGARYAGRTLDDFSNLTADVTRSTFGDLTITANWNKLAPYIDGNNSLASGGFSARTNDNTLEAGIFSGIYNGSTLTNGEHYLVIARSLQKVTVSQPVGSDSLLP